MPLSFPSAIDFTRLRTPPNHGDVLIIPEAASWAAAARTNAEVLRHADVPLVGSTLAYWRRKTREEVVGGDDRLVIATGHQPEFVHPGVWAKHVVAMRLAEAVDGVGVHLVVDTDAPTQATVAVPVVRGQRVALRAVPFAEVPAGHTYEQIPRQTSTRVVRFEQGIRNAMGERYADSQMSTFFEALAGAPGSRDWVDQTVAARRAIEKNFGVMLEERRVSRHWSSPLLLDMLINAPRFAAGYNRALARYRRANHVRGSQRPIPDLRRVDDRWEVPVWAQRAGSIRQRLFVSNAGGGLRLYAGDVGIGAFAVASLESCDDLEDRLDGWRLRPRALALTIWARLLLADLFIHGIGGAKYDRISDGIIADYYGLVPPHVVCVSATLLLDLPVGPTTPESVRRVRHAVRDVYHNPQRNLVPEHDLNTLLEKRAAAVRRAIALRATEPRNRQARRRAFQEIREINTAFRRASPGILSTKQAEVTRVLDDLRQNEIARGRGYFFGFYNRKALEQLADALPAERGFRV